MVITKFIRRGCIIPELSATSKPEVLRELIDVLFDKKKKDTADTAITQILGRESTESTGIGRGIAVPHARVTGLKTLSCAVGRVPDGLDFMAVDRKPVHLIFLICYPPTEQTKYLNFIATVARLLHDPEHLQGMLDAGDAGEMYDIMKEASTTFTESHEEEYARKLKSAPDLKAMGDANASLMLLARLQLCQEMMDAARSGKGEIKHRIETIRGLIDPRILSHYDRLTQSRAPALVPVEGDTCQGCFMKLASQFVQKVRQDEAHLHTCLNCKRFVYVV
jgi:PTS system nitrogen regulatory IIA component